MMGQTVEVTKAHVNIEVLMRSAVRTAHSMLGLAAQHYGAWGCLRRHWPIDASNGVLRDPICRASTVSGNEYFLPEQKQARFKCGQKQTKRLPRYGGAI